MYKATEKASTVETSVNKISLQDRLQTRHENALRAFRESMKHLHESIDCSEKEIALRLKKKLDESHAETAFILTDEKHKIQEHQELLDKQAVLTDEVSEGGVLSPLEDRFFSLIDIDYESGMGRMKAERYRLLDQAVDLQQKFHARISLIRDSVSEMMEHEIRRKRAVQHSLRDLMLTFAKISYCNVTMSHVLAQRELHSINQTIAANYEGIQMLFVQLSSREVLKQERYATTMSGIYHEALHCMAKSSAYWLFTLLHSAYFRRPAERAESIAKVARVALSVHRDGVKFLNNFRVMIDSLSHVAKPPEATREEDYQLCGGSVPNGWLRSYRGEASSGLAPIHDCTDVVDEWRMKANVVVCNNSSRCREICSMIEEMENARVGVAERLEERLWRIFDWVCAPMEREDDLLRLASVPEVSLLGSKGETDPSLVKDQYKAFVVNRASEAAELQKNYQRLLDPVIASIRAESHWFAGVMMNGLQKKQYVFEQVLLRGSGSLLQLFDKASEALVYVVQGVVGYLRKLYQDFHDARMCYKDELKKMEHQLTVLQDSLIKADSKENAERLFSEGLNCLEQIAQHHIRFHNETNSSLDEALSSVYTNTNQYCRTMLDKISVESVRETEDRLAREHQAKIEALKAMVALHEQQQQKGKRGNRKGGEEIANRLALEPITEDTVPMESITYPQLISYSGEVYNVIAPMRFVQQESYASHAPANSALVPDSIKVSDEFVSCYNALFLDSPEEELESFISEECDEWKEALRLGLLNWTLQLCAYTIENIKAFCEHSRSNQSIETSELLRSHRRRPAAFQVQVYESSLRRLEDSANVAMKYGLRLRERVATVLSIHEEFDKNEAWKCDDRQVLVQLKEMESEALKAPNSSTLQSRQRQHKGLCTHYMNCIDHRAEVLLDRIKTTISTLTIELNQLQTSHSPHLIDGGKPAMEQIQAVLNELEEAEVNVRRQADIQRQQRLRTIELLESSYKLACACAISELNLISRLQECATRFKVQLQSFISASKAFEDTLNRDIDLLDKSRHHMPSKLDFVGNILAQIRLDAPVTSEVETVDSYKGDASLGNPLPGMEALTMQLERELQANRVRMHQMVQTSPVTDVLRTLDQLRERFYIRGIILQALSYSVELLVVDPEGYINPKVITTSSADAQSLSHNFATASERAGSNYGGTGRRSGKGPRSHDTAHSSAPVPEQRPLPAAISALTQLGVWAAAFKAAAMETAQAHFETYSLPLHRSLPRILVHADTTETDSNQAKDVYVKQGSLEEVERAIDRMCHAQEVLMRVHLKESLKVYRQQLQLSFKVVQVLPQWLSTYVYYISSTSVNLDMQSVLHRFESFYNKSAARRITNNRRLKVWLGSQSRKDLLQQLITSESNRQTLATEVTARFWGFALRVLQEEAREHAVRCYTSTYNLACLLRGLVTPAHSIALSEGEVVEGHHRSLKHLRQLRAKNTQVASQNEPLSNNSSNRDGRLTDAALPRKQESANNRRGIGISAKDRGGATNLDSIHSNTKVIAPLSYAMVELLGLPTGEVRALEAFCAEHPEWAVLSPISTNTFSAPSAFENPGVASTTGAAGRISGAGKRVAQPEPPAAAPPVTLRTLAFLVPDTRVYREAVMLAHKSSEEFNRTVQEAVQHINKAFHGWLKREEHYKQTWELSVKTLQHPCGRKCSFASAMGPGLFKDGNTEQS